jgi:hypothetical protein
MYKFFHPQELGLNHQAKPLLWLNVGALVVVVAVGPVEMLLTGLAVAALAAAHITLEYFRLLI